MIREIATLISTLTGWTIGSDLQVGHRAQDAPERCRLVSEAGGGESNYYIPDSMNVNIQIITRAKTYMTARDDAWVAFEKLQGTAGWNMPNLASGPDYLAEVIEAIMTPQYIGQDANGLFEFSTNYIFRVREGSCVESP